jgi:pentatricopeptide repeat protein
MEIQIFLVAFCTYALFRAKHRAPTKSVSFPKKVDVPEEGDDLRLRTQATRKQNSKFQSDSESSYRNAVIKALRAGDANEAREAIEIMCKAGHSPSRSMFNELLDVTIKSTSDDVWSVIDFMQTCAMKPNRITCSILLKNMKTGAKDCGVVRILETLNDMDDDFDEVLINSVVEACMRVGRADLLIPHLQHEKFAKVKLSNSWTYANIIRAYSSVANIEGVWKTWYELRKTLPVPSKVTVAYMVEALCTNGQNTASHDLVREMVTDAQTKHLVTSVTYGSLLKGYSHAKEFDKVLSTYRELLDLELKLSLVTFNTLMDACARCGEMTHIPGLLKDMSQQGVEPNIITYSIIIKAYCQLNRLDEALKVWKDMVETTSFKPDEAMYNTLLAGCARKGLYDRGMDIFDEMQRADVRPSNVTLSVLVKLAKRRHLLDKAFELCKDVSAKYKIRPNIHVLNNLLQACLESDDLPRAFSVLSQMAEENVQLDVRTYTLLLQECISRKKAQEASSLLQLAYGIRCSVPIAGLASDNAASLCKVKGGLPFSIVIDTVESIGVKCGNAAMASGLIQDLTTQGVRIPSDVKLRIASLMNKSC